MNVHRHAVSRNRVQYGILTALLLFLSCTQQNPLDPASSLGKKLSILANMSAAPSRIQTGGQKSHIQVRLNDEDGKAVNGATVTFQTTLGSLTRAGAVTDPNGWARDTLQSGTVAGWARVTASYQQTTVVDSVQISSLADTSGFALQLSSDSDAILANGISTAKITVQLISRGTQSIPGRIVTLATTAGSIPGSLILGENGSAEVILTSEIKEQDVIATVTAQFGDQIETTQVLLVGVQMVVSTTPHSILADGRSTSTVTVVMKRAVSTIAITGETVYFGTTLGTIPASAVTNTEGVAQVSLTSGTTLGIARVTARYGKFVYADTVNFQESVPKYLELSTTPPVLPADGQSQSRITVKVIDANNNPAPDGTIVQFKVRPGLGTIEPLKMTLSGIVTTLLTAGNQPGTDTVLVSVDNLRDTTLVVYTVGEVYQVIVTSDSSSLRANGLNVTHLQAKVMDAQGNPVSGVTVTFSASIGDITHTAPTDGAGVAVANFSSGVIGNSTITATVLKPDGRTVSGTKDIQLLPGSSNSMGLRFEPNWIGVRDTGQNQTMTIFSDIRDGKNNPVFDGTLVKFSIIGSSLGCQFSTSQSIPTVAGTAQISLTSGTVSGSVRIRADVVNAQGSPVSPAVNATSSQLIVHAGPPYIENVNDLKTTHLTVAASRLNIWKQLDTTQVSIMVGDKYNNPVEKGTAVYLTTSGGVVSTHTAYTNEYGKAKVILTGGNPQPTIDRFYNYLGLQDPNTKAILPGFAYYGASGDYRLPNFDAYPESAGSGEVYPGINAGRIFNSEGNTTENDGIARIIAYTEGVDARGLSARPWDWMAVAMSGPMQTVEDNSIVVSAQYGGFLYDGESATIRITVMDDNGNPISSDTDFQASLTNSASQAKLSWTTFRTGAGMGTSYYYITISNAIDPEKPKSSTTGIRIQYTNAFQYHAWDMPGKFLIQIVKRP
jgi:adhesin/invasin